MAEDADRKAFFERLTSFNREHGHSNNTSPTISKQSLDLYLLYNTIKSRGGFVDVSKARQWKDCANLCNLTLNSSAAYTLKKQYIKHLLPYECHFDRGGVDPAVLIAQTEPASKSKGSKNKGSAPSPGPGDSNSQGSLSSNSTTCSTSYPTSGTPNAGDGLTPPAGYPGIPPPQQQQPQGPPPSIPSGYALPGQHLYPPPHSSYNGSAYPPPPPPQHQGYPYQQQQYPPPPAGHPGHQNHPQPTHGWHHQTQQPPPQTGMPSLGHHQPTVPSSTSSANNCSSASSSESIAVQDPFDDMSNSYPPGRAVPPRATPPTSTAPPPPQPYQQPVHGGKPASYGPYQPQQPYGYPPGHPASSTASMPPPGVGVQQYQRQQSFYQPPQQRGYDYRDNRAYDGQGYGGQQPQGPPPQSSSQYGHTSGPPQPVQPPQGSTQSRHGPPPRSTPPGTPQPPSSQGYPPTSGGKPYPQSQPDSRASPASTPPSAPSPSGQPHPQQQPHPPPQGYPGQAAYGHQPPPQQQPPHQYPGERYPRPEEYNRQANGYQSHHPYRPPGPGPQQQAQPQQPYYGQQAGGGPQHHQQQRPAPYDYRDSRAYQRQEMQQQGPYPSHPGQQQAHPMPPQQQHPRPPGSMPPPLSQASSSAPVMPPSSQPPSLYGPNREAGPPRYPIPPNQHPGMPSHVPPQGHSIHHGMGPPSMHPGQGHAPGPQPFPLAGPGAGPLNPSFAPHPSHQHPTPAPGMMIPPLMMARKEMSFPPGCVESTQPILTKRRKITARDVSQIEAWRILMCLKSGLLAESTWALDVLSVLAFDENTFACFVLSGMPGLLDTLLEHFKKCLSQIFDGILDCEEMRRKKAMELRSNCNEFSSVFRYRVRSSRTCKWFQLEDDVEEVQPCHRIKPLLYLDPLEPVDNPERTSILTTSVTDENQEVMSHNDAIIKRPDIPSAKAFPLQENQEVCLKRSAPPLVLLNGPLNWTNRSRDGKPVKILDSKEDQFVTVNDIESRWKRLRSPFSNDVLEKREEDVENWDGSQHILTQFCPPTKFVRFVKLLNGKNDKTDENIVNQIKDNGTNDAKVHQNINSVKNEEEKSVDGSVSKVALKRKHDLFDELEEEAFEKDHPSLYPVDEYCEGLARRCIVLSTLIRNLSFVPGNENEIARHHELLRVLSRLLLLNHEHPVKSKSNITRPPVTDDSLFNEEELNKIEQEVKETEHREEESELDLGTDEWYWDTMHLLLENTLVTIANVSGQVDLSPFSEDVSLPLLDGLLHWAVCPSSYAQDHMPMTSLTNLSPSRLAMETLVKLSIREGNVDLILATPPWERLDRLFKNLTKMLARNEDQTLREFSLVLLVNLTSADSAIARSVALTGNAIPQLISFVEQSEQSAMSIAQSHGVNALRENPEMMGTTLDMVRRAALCLRSLARVPENRPLFMVSQQRLLNLVMSQILDQGVAAILADVMYECSLSDPTLQATKEVFLPYISPVTADVVVDGPQHPHQHHPATSRPMTPPSNIVAANGVGHVKEENHLPEELVSHTSLLNQQQKQTNGSLNHHEQLTSTDGVLSASFEQKRSEVQSHPSQPLGFKPTTSPIMNGTMDPCSPANHIDYHHHTGKIELNKVPPAVKMEQSFKGMMETTPVVAVVNHHQQPDVKNNGTNSPVAVAPPPTSGNSNDPSKGCPRLKELLLSYQMSPKFDSTGGSNPGSGVESPVPAAPVTVTPTQQTEQISS